MIIMIYKYLEIITLFILEEKIQCVIICQSLLKKSSIE